MTGIQIHPHDILDEGMTQVFSYIDKLHDIKYVFPEINTIFERNPNPIGVLPHNPIHKVVHGNGKMHVYLPDYPNAKLDQLRQEPLLPGKDPLMIIKKASQGRNKEIIPWANILNGDFVGTALEDNLVTDVDDNKVHHWLCPNAPDVIDFWEKVFLDLYHYYGFTTYMIDRIRYPDWGGKEVNPKALLTCFCPHCQKKMLKQGLDVNAIKSALSKWQDYFKQKKFLEAIEYAESSKVINEWIIFRQQSVSNFVKNLIERLHKKNDDFVFWLDLWPPAYSWILGQDYQKLTQLSPALKHFPYHKLGGGADVQGLINYLTDTKEEQEDAFIAFCQYFNLDYAITYSQFKEEGFPIQFVSDQNNIARKKSAKNTRIFSGIQMWNISPDNLIEAIKAGENSAADELLYYCYGWADDALYTAIAEFRKGENKYVNKKEK